jgi:hypothetical protein
VTPEIIARVDAWLAARRETGWFDEGDRATPDAPAVGRLVLHGQWLVCKAFGPGRNPAATGILLALVREAWGCHVKVEWGRRCEVAGPNYGQPVEWLVWGMGHPRLATGPTEDDALAAALEAASC